MRVMVLVKATEDSGKAFAQCPLVRYPLERRLRPFVLPPVSP
jgi:hypothetical protein